MRHAPQNKTIEVRVCGSTEVKQQRKPYKCYQNINFQQLIEILVGALAPSFPMKKKHPDEVILGARMFLFPKDRVTRLTNMISVRWSANLLFMMNWI
jgi:hypothetical protein